jgi:16S rRNA (guanine527-N7)-methyltransferase
MSAPPLGEQIQARARQAALVVPDGALEQLVSYYTLLERWNQKINLTALVLAAREDATIDRLIVEPLVAAESVPSDAALAWFDFGSGGGSPAIPLKVVRPALSLVMVESRARKAAFLREAVSMLALPTAKVDVSRIEQLVQIYPVGVADLITMRAVRVTPPVLDAARSLLKSHGKLLIFRGADTALDLPLDFEIQEERPLVPSAGLLSTLVKS